MYTCCGITRPGPTRACALPVTFQAMPSPTQHEFSKMFINSYVLHASIARQAVNLFLDRFI